MADDNGITLAEAKIQLATWLLADAKVAEGQSHRLAANGTDRQLTMADAAEIRRNVEFWDTKVRELANGGVIRVFGIIPPC
jgi:hypothetical protein